MRKAVPEIDRFNSRIKVNPETKCWEWHGQIDKDGYGNFYSKTAGRAHVWSYRHHKGEIPNGLELDHLCRVKHCANPDHLEPVTKLENIRRAKASRAHCRKGHEYSVGTTYLNTRRDRCCKICRKAAWTKGNAKRPRRIVKNKE